MEIFVFLLFFLVFWIVGGHLVWLGVAALFRGIANLLWSPKHRLDLPGQTVEEPGQQKIDSDRSLESKSLQRPDPLADVEAAVRLMQLARFKDWINDEKHFYLLSTIDAMKRRLSNEVTSQNQSSTTQNQPARTTLPGVQLDSLRVQSHGIHQRKAELSEDAPENAQDDLQPAHALDRQYDSSQSKSTCARAAAAKRRLTVDVLKAFMQRANVQWIELISAALIVICSVGLVVSLWSTLSKTSRFFPAILFCMATMTVHCVGHYTLWKWKLRSTSRGILHIGLLLIPLAVMVGILLSQRTDQSFRIDISTSLVIAIGATIYSGLTLWTASALFGRRHWSVTLATVAACVSLLMIHLFQQSGQLTLLAVSIFFVPVFIAHCFAAMQLMNNDSRRWIGSGTLATRSYVMAIHLLFSLLGVIVFFVFRFYSTALQSVMFHGFTSSISFIWLVYAIANLVSFRRHASNVVVSLRQKRNAQRNQIFAITYWVFASIATPAILWLTWHAAYSRFAIVGLLLFAATWLIAVSRFVRLPLAREIIVGAFAFASAWMIEGFISSTASPTMKDWLAWPKVAGLLLSGILMIVASRFAATWSISTRSSSIVVLSLATMLAFISGLLQLLSASEVSQWPEAVLFAVGISAFILVGYWDWKVQSGQVDELTSFHRLADIIIGLGTVILAIAALHFVRLNPNFANLFPALNSLQSASIALTSVALIASVGGWIIEVLHRRVARRTDDVCQFKLRSGSQMPPHLLMCSIGCVTAIFCLPMIWFSRQHISMLIAFGWVFPLATLAMSDVLKNLTLRELARLFIAACVTLTVYRLGHQSHWFDSLHFATINASHAAFFVAICGTCHLLDRILSLKRRARDQFWSVAVASIVSYLVIACNIAFPAVLRSAHSLHDSPTPVSAIDNPFALQSTAIRNSDLSTTQAATIFVAFLTIMVATSHIARSPLAKQWVRISLSSMIFFMSLNVAGLSAMVWSVPYSIVASSWSLLISIGLAGTAISLQLKNASSQFRRDLVVMIVISAIGLTGLSIAAFYAACFNHLAPQLLGVGFATSLMWTLPLTVVLLASWLLASLQFQHRSAATVVAFALTAWTACSLLLWDHASNVGVYAKLALWLQLFIGGNCLLQWLYVLLDRRRIQNSAITGHHIIKKNKAAELHQNSLTLANIVSQSLLSIGVLVALNVSVFPGKTEATRYLGSSLGISAVIVLLGTLLSLPTLRRKNFIDRRRLAIAAAQLLIPLVVLFVAICFKTSFVTLPSLVIDWKMSHGISTIVIGLMIGEALRRLFFPNHSASLIVLHRKSQAAWIKIYRVTFENLQVAALGIIVAFALINHLPMWTPILFTMFALLFLLWSFPTQANLWGHVAVVMAFIASGTTRWLQSQSSLYVVVSVLLWSALTIGFVSHSVRFFIRRRRGIVNRLSASSALMESRRIEIFVAYALPLATITMSFCLLFFPTLRDVGKIGVLAISLVLGALLLSFLNLFSLRLNRALANLYLALFAVMLMIAAWSRSAAEIPQPYAVMLYMVAFSGTPTLAAAFMRVIKLSPWIRTSQNRLSQRLREIDVDYASQRLKQFHSIVALIGVVLTLQLSLNSSDWIVRSSAIAIPFLSALSLLWLPRIDTGNRAIALALLGLCMILFGVRDLPSLAGAATEVQYIHVIRIFLASTCYAVILLAIAAFKFVDAAWLRLLYRGSWTISFLAIFFGAIGLLIGWLYLNTALPNRLGMAPQAFMIIGWALLVARCLQYAAKPFQNESDVAIRYRSWSVYLAEFLIIALGTQFYLFYPDLFGGWLRAWWPVAVMIIVLVSILLGQILQLDRSAVFGNPLRQTNLLLPLVPLSSVWFLQLQAGWTQWDHFGSLLIGATVLYSVQSWIYQSAWLQMLAAIAGVLSLWSFLMNQDATHFLSHPQFWLVPPAITALYFVERNRSIFSPPVLIAARYFAVLIAYLSSTADMLLLSFGGSVWMPILLLSLSMLGMAAGMVFRVTSLLYCGIAFIFVSLIGMVWHAQRAIGEIWPWWAFGIGCGVALIVFLGYLEKNRDRAWKFLQELKAWET